MLKALLLTIVATTCFFGSIFSMEFLQRYQSKQKFTFTKKELERIRSKMKGLTFDEILASMGLVKLSLSQSKKKLAPPKK